MENPFAPTRPPARWFVLRWLALGATLAALLAVAEYGYRFYDQNTSPEVRVGGVKVPAQLLEGQSAGFSICPDDDARFLQVRVSTEEARASDAEEARAGIPGTLTVREAVSGGREWTVPFLLVAPAAAISRHPSVEPDKNSSLGGGIGLGVRYHIDFDFSPTGSGEAAYRDLYGTLLPAGTPLDIRFEFAAALGPGSKAFLSYSRHPRLLHQRLFRGSR